VLAAAGLAACHSDDSPAATDDLDQIAEPATSQDCVDFAGNKHCALGNAKLALAANGASLQASGLAVAASDGVQILLPDVTQFTPSGAVNRNPSGNTLVARAISTGVATSSLTVQRSATGFSIAANFTGSGAGSTYNALLYNSGQLVGTIGGLTSGGPPMFPTFPCSIIPCTIHLPPVPHLPTFFVVPRSGGVGTPGACGWKLNFEADNLIQVTLGNGSTVIADAIALVENVPGQGSYPYLTFNEIDYTTDALGLEIDGEATE
jgi:hypothetical protein